MTSNTLYKTLNKEWLKEAKKTVKESSYLSFVTTSQNHIVKKFGDIKIGLITEKMVQDYIFELYDHGRIDGKGGLSIKTIRDVILVLKLSLNYAYINDIIDSLSWDKIKYPKESTPIDAVKALSAADEKLLIQAIYLDLNRKSAGLLMALFTGVRIGELCGIQMKDISITENTIRINKTVQRVYDKEKKTTKVHIGSPKTTSSDREIPVPSLLMNVIKKFHTDDGNHYFLTGKKTPTEPRTYRQYFKRFLKRNNLQDMKFHEVRHTFATRAIELPEFDIKSLSEILGHKSVAFTLNVYGRANKIQKAKCMNLMNDLL